jgi:hypothetical protein
VVAPRGLQPLPNGRGSASGLELLHSYVAHPIPLAVIIEGR